MIPGEFSEAELRPLARRLALGCTGRHIRRQPAPGVLNSASLYPVVVRSWAVPTLSKTVAECSIEAAPIIAAEGA